MVRLIARKPATLSAIFLLAGCASAPPAQPSPRTSTESPPGVETPPGVESEVVSPPGPEYSLTLALHDQADAARLRGDYDTAVATLERAIRIDPDAPELWLLLSQVNLDAGDPAAAEQLARKALQFVGNRARLEQQAWSLIDTAERQVADQETSDDERYRA